MMHLRRVVAAVAVVTMVLAAVLAVRRGAPAGAPAGEPPLDIASAIRQVVDRRTDLVALYDPAGFEPLWVDDGGTLNSPAHDALRLLAWALSDGLSAADYAVAELQALAEIISGTGTQSVDALAGFDVALSEAVLRYLRDLHVGRVAPRDVGFALDAPPEDHDFPALVRDAVARRQLVELAHTLTKRGQQYQALVVALARYRERAQLETDVALVTVKKSVHPGERYPALPALRARLVLLGDLDVQLPAVVGDVYEGTLVEGVRHFQRRHSIDPDGVLGASTIAELTVPLAWRVRQIELAMEEQRWLRHLPDGRLIVVNIPMFRVSAWDTSVPGGAPAFTSRVIVGRETTPTPVVSGPLSEVIFRPYWNVPVSIVRKEILPTLARRPDYIERERMELVAGQTDESPVVSTTPENLALLRSGRVRLRQRPGPDNALGLIKFSFRNEYDVYMHSTPAPSLFAGSSRALSHGCIRVQDPVGLGAWVLGNEWDRDRITEAMNAPNSSRVAVRPPLGVILLNTTAEVRFDSGDVAFAPDIYGHDARLDRAIRLRGVVTK